jgi:hypothetical protein
MTADAVPAVAAVAISSTAMDTVTAAIARNRAGLSSSPTC